MRARLLGAAAAVMVVGGAAAAVGPSLRSHGPCQAVRQEPLDVRSFQHVLPGAATPVYARLPPTSGPHQVAVVDGGVVDVSYPPQVQVGILEGGRVLVQHQGISGPQFLALRAIAGPDVVVAPGEDIGAPIVATSWQRRLVCSDVDLGALRRFVATREAPPGHR